MNKDPLVSVIMATFNEPERFIKEAIASILNQTHRNLELLIADDSTSEETIRVIDDFASKDNRVIIIRKKERMGFVNALNEALDLAKGDYIARMDGDDVSLPNRFEIQLKYAEDHPDVDVFGGNIIIIDKNGNELSERSFPIRLNEITKRFVFRSPFSHPTVMFKRRIIDDGNKYNPKYKKAEDVDFFLRLKNQGYIFGNTGVFLIKWRTVEDLHKKRSKDQWVYNHLARSENFTWSKPFFSIFSWSVSLIYKYVPSFLVSFYYRKENKKFV